MYQDQGMVNSRTPQQQVKETTMSENAVSRLMVINDERDKILYEISEKLHSISNQRGPMSPGQPENPSPMESDFFSKMHRQIGRVEDDNAKLRSILNHLNQIV